MQYIHTTISAKEIDHTREYIFYIRKVLCPQYFQNTFTKNHKCYVVIGSNLNLLLKLLFCPPITTLTNCHLKFVVKVFILQLTKDSLINNSIQTFSSIWLFLLACANPHPTHTKLLQERIPWWWPQNIRKRFQTQDLMDILRP